MLVDAFDFDLPKDRIATRPKRPRDSARMLVVGEDFEDSEVRDLPSFLRSGDILVVNNTRVIPARLSGLRDGVKVQLTLDRELGNGRWRALALPARKLKVGSNLTFQSDLTAVVVSKGNRGSVELDFDVDAATILSFLKEHGTIPLPPYIERPDGPDTSDSEDYQTVYARTDGAVAAPTAGLHFTTELLSSLKKLEIDVAQITLHVGPGTFRPVNAEDTKDHSMDGEWGEITPTVAARINSVRANGGRVVSVGTTVLRLLEFASSESGHIIPFNGDTNLFITPGYRFRAVDQLLTNFHLPRSTLFMLVCAFCGLEKMHEAYAYAIRQKYRFYSYGDASLLKLTSVK